MRLTALVAGKLPDYALGLRPRPHTAGDPLGPKTTRTSAFVTGGLVCCEAALHKLARLGPGIPFPWAKVALRGNIAPLGVPMGRMEHRGPRG